MVENGGWTHEDCQNKAPPFLGTWFGFSLLVSMKLRRTPRIGKAIERLEASAAQRTREGYGTEWIEHEFLIELATLTHVPLSELVRGTEVYFEPVVVPEKSKDYLDLMAKLRVQQQEREYQELLGNKEDPVRLKPGSIDAKAVKEEITTIFNIMISVGAVAYAIWRWTPHWSLQTRTLASIFGAFFILVAEVVVYLGYRRRVDEAREAAKNLKEKRKVIEVWPIESEKPSNDSITTEDIPTHEVEVQTGIHKRR